MPAKMQIQQKWEDMTGYAYIILRHMPKSERFTLGAELRESLWRGIRLIVQAGHLKNKRRTLWDLDAEIKTIQAMIRVAYVLRIVDHKKYELLSARLVEIGKMLGGWIRSQRLGADS